MWLSFWRLVRDRESDIMLIPLPTGGSTTRRIPRPITAASIHDWCDSHGVHGDERHAFRTMVDAMDDAAREEIAALSVNADG